MLVFAAGLATIRGGPFVAYGTFRRLRSKARVD